MIDKCIIYDNKSDFADLKSADKKNILLSDVEENYNFTQQEEVYYKIALSFYELFLSNVKNLGGITKQVEKIDSRAIDTIRLMSNDYSLEDFRKIYMFLRDTVFWHLNIRSFAKLKAKANDLLMRYNAQSIKYKPIEDAANSIEHFDRNF